MILRQRLKPHTAIDLTPLIDVVFQLVIFFMISSVFNTAPGIELELPNSRTSEAVEVTEIRVTVVSEEEVYLNRDLVPLTSLGEELQRQSTEGRFKTDTALLVEGGRNVAYETIVKVLDEIRLGGMGRVNLITLPLGEEP